MSKELWDIIILAALQGITEFLPVSSSGHLAIVEKIFNTGDPVLVAVALHAGTLLSIFIVYFREILNLLKPESRNILLMIVAGTVPAGIIGVSVKLSGLDEKIFSDMFVPGCGLFATGFILLWTMKKSAQEKSVSKMNFRDAILIGFVQAAAVLPGISRSGSTISAALRLKYKSEDSSLFSFLLAVPAIGGAAFVEGVSYLGKRGAGGIAESFPLWQLAVGFCISALAGYVALNMVLESVRRGKLSSYAFYCFFLGAAVIGWRIWEIF